MAWDVAGTVLLEPSVRKHFLYMKEKWALSIQTLWSISMIWQKCFNNRESLRRPRNCPDKHYKAARRYWETSI
jgi:hypothetical protein